MTKRISSILEGKLNFIKGVMFRNIYLVSEVKICILCAWDCTLREHMEKNETKFCECYKVSNMDNKEIQMFRECESGLV